jgi:two-component system sensor histidine kinase KdpD
MKRHAFGILLSAASVAAVTGVVFALKPFAPVLSLGVLYVVAVVVVAVTYGLAYAIPVSIASLLVFNWFFLPPLHTFELRESENWVALAVYLVTAIVVSELATRSRRRAFEAEQRRREATLFADVSTELLQADRVEPQLREIARRIGEVLGTPGARLELESLRRPEADEQALELTTGSRQVGTLFVERGAAVDEGVRRRVLPGIASLLAVALDRERLRRRALEAETLRRSDAVKTAVLRAVSHDLRSPLTAIRAAVDGLESGSIELTEGDRSMLLEAIDVETARLDRLVSNLIDLSRLEAGAATPAPELWTADGIVARALDALGPGAERVSVELPEETLPLRVDASHVERALVNLLENALKFSGEAAAVEVVVAQDGSEVLISVVDHGPGLAPGEAERVFEPFQRGRGERAGGGSGLGLSIAKGFAEVNGGRLWVESAPGAGARFVLAFPLAARTPALR